MNHDSEAPYLRIQACSLKSAGEAWWKRVRTLRLKGVMCVIWPVEMRDLSEHRTEMSSAGVIAWA